jgi:hypothetical protein
MAGLSLAGLVVCLVVFNLETIKQFTIQKGIYTQVKCFLLAFGVRF